MTNGQGSNPETTPGSASDATHLRPRTRQRVYKPPPPLDVPDIEDDAAERKRILNVLAQRRYRERKRQSRKPRKPSGSDQGEIVSASGADVAATTSDQVTVSSHSPPVDDGPEPAGPVSGDVDISDVGTIIDADFDTSWSSEMPSLSMGSKMLNSFLPNTLLGAGEIDFDDAGASSSAVALPSTINPASLMGSSSSSTASTVSFPDSYLLPVNELTIIRAITRISQALNCKDEFWNLCSVSPFYRGTATPSEQLPKALQPTPTQILVPHHPVLDFLPWPGVRERTISIFSLPDEMRPPNAAGPLGLVNFAYDLEDGSEGIRIWGDDLFNPASWEVGQLLFERWWFLFDRDIVANSNRWRRLRGAPTLRIHGSSK